MELGRKLMRLPQENGTIVYDLGDFGFSNMVRRACRRHRSHNGVVQCSQKLDRIGWRCIVIASRTLAQDQEFMKFMIDIMQVRLERWMARSIWPAPRC